MQKRISNTSVLATMQCLQINMNTINIFFHLHPSKICRLRGMNIAEEIIKGAAKSLGAPTIIGLLIFILIATFLTTSSKKAALSAEIIAILIVLLLYTCNQ